MSALPDRPVPDDQDIETHRARIQAAVEYYINSLKWYADWLWELYRPQTRWWLGTCTSLSTPAKTVTVDLEPMAQGTPPPGLVAGWGRKTWTAGQIVGKRVRVLLDDETGAMWVDDVLS